MKTQKIIFYIFKWMALIFLTVMIAKENPSKTMMFLLVGIVVIILIWEGIRDFTANNKT